MRLVGSRVPCGVPPSESGMQKRARGDQPGTKRLSFGGPEGVTEKQRGAEGVQAAHHAGGATLASASQTQGGRMLFGFQSEIGDAGVLAGGLGGGGGGHHRGGGG